MNGVVAAPKVERDVEILAAWYKPPFVFGIVEGTRNATIDGIRYISRDLGKGESESGMRTGEYWFERFGTYPLSTTATNWPLGALGTIDLSRIGWPSGPIIPLSSSVKACQC